MRILLGRFTNYMQNPIHLATASILLGCTILLSCIPAKFSDKYAKVLEIIVGVPVLCLMLCSLDCVGAPVDDGSFGLLIYILLGIVCIVGGGIFLMYSLATF